MCVTEREKPFKILSLSLSQRCLCCNGDQQLFCGRCHAVCHTLLRSQVKDCPRGLRPCLLSVYTLSLLSPWLVLLDAGFHGAAMQSAFPPVSVWKYLIYQQKFCLHASRWAARLCCTDTHQCTCVLSLFIEGDMDNMGHQLVTTHQNTHDKDLKFR